MRLITSYPTNLKEGVIMGFLWGLTVGIFIGAFVGVGIMCLMITAKEADKRMEDQYK
jgi:NhaP-type Na+/H+ and K+/H+ antiporter